MDKDLFSRWCDTATEQIKYRPDRLAVRRELLAHLEDSKEILLSQGLSNAEAEQQATQRMGSAQELAPQLAALHKPWLGFILSFIRLAAICVIALAVFLWSCSGISLAHSLTSSKQFEALPANYGNLDYYAKPNVKAKSDGRLFRVSEAGFQCEQALFRCQLDIICMPYMRYNDIVGHIWAIDSNGNRYVSQSEAGFQEIPCVRMGGYSSSALISSHYLTITQFDCSAQWVELHYDRDGRDVVLRIQLPGGAQS